jgi:hypothetical protein
MAKDARVLFLHHSTGKGVWGGGFEDALAAKNAQLGTSYSATQRDYPDTPYPWQNYPADYYRLWVTKSDPNIVTNPNDANYLNTASLETLSKNVDLIVWKHCFPVSIVGADQGSADPASDTRTLANYKAAYLALLDKMRSFPNNRFLVWTGAVEREGTGNDYISPEQANRFKAFRDWVVNTWDQKGDNIFVFDFYTMETGGGIYLLPANASGDNHPNDTFNQWAAPRFAARVCDVLQGRGDSGSLTGY